MPMNPLAGIGQAFARRPGEPQLPMTDEQQYEAVMGRRRAPSAPINVTSDQLSTAMSGAQASRLTPAPTSTYIDQPGETPQFPTFLEHVIPANATPPSDERTPIPGEAGTDASGSFDELAGMGAAAENLKAIEARRSQAQGNAIGAQNNPVSTGRKIAAIAGGVGMGVATMNPMAGFGVGSAIWNGDRNSKASQFQGEAANAATAFKNEEAIGGLYGQVGQRRAELGQAAGRQHEASNVDTQNTYERNNPKINSITSGNGQPILTPDRAASPAAAAAASVPVGQPNPGKSQVTWKVQPDGTAVALIADENGETRSKVLPGIKLASAEEKSAFTQGRELFKQSHPNATPGDEYKAALTWQATSAIQAGANQQAVLTTQGQRDSLIGEAIAALNAAFMDDLESDASLSDPTKKAVWFQDMISELGNEPRYKPVIQDIMNMPRFKSPTKGSNESPVGQILKDAAAAEAAKKKGP